MVPKTEAPRLLLPTIETVLAAASPYYRFFKKHGRRSLVAPDVTFKQHCAHLS